MQSSCAVLRIAKTPRNINFTADVPLTRIAMPCWAKVGKDIAVEQGSKMYKRGK